MLLTMTRCIAQSFACSAKMDVAGWMKPLNPVGARAKVEEALQSLIHEERKKSIAVKRSSEVDNVDPEQPLSKRAYLETDLKQAVDPTSTTLVKKYVQSVLQQHRRRHP